MFKKEDLDKYQQKERLGAETYLTSYVDFVKWTTTLDLAAIVWLATVTSSYVGLARWLTLLGLASLVIALVLAVLALKTVLDTSAHEWDVARLHHSLALLDLFETSGASEDFVKRKRDELTKRFNELSQIGDKFYGTQLFNRLATWHTATLAGGVVLYALGQLVTVTSAH